MVSWGGWIKKGGISAWKQRFFTDTTTWVEEVVRWSVQSCVKPLCILAWCLCVFANKKSPLTMDGTLVSVESTIITHLFLCQSHTICSVAGYFGSSTGHIASHPTTHTYALCTECLRRPIPLITIFLSHFSLSIKHIYTLKMFNQLLSDQSDIEQHGQELWSVSSRILSIRNGNKREMR